MHRKITSDDVKSYASHIPSEEVELDKEEDMEYRNGVLTHANGDVSCKLMTRVSAVLLNQMYMVEDYDWITSGLHLKLK